MNRFYEGFKKRIGMFHLNGSYLSGGQKIWEVHIFWVIPKFLIKFKILCYIDLFINFGFAKKIWTSQIFCLSDEQELSKGNLESFYVVSSKLRIFPFLLSLYQLVYG